jgi:hypothetical protein
VEKKEERDYEDEEEKKGEVEAAVVKTEAKQ